NREKLGKQDKKRWEEQGRKTIIESERTNILQRRPVVKWKKRSREETEEESTLINKVWNAISDSIIYAANKNIPYKKISNTVASKSAKKRDVLEKINWTIQGINKRLGTLIPHIEST
ncbi:17776_t:CDS:2, partial [Gigaspora rosea]